MPEDMPEDMPDRMPEDMSEYMPEDMPVRMPDRMPEDMSDRMPQDLSVRKCINVMVGITRSKVFFFFFGLPVIARTWIHELGIQQDNQAADEKKNGVIMSIPGGKPHDHPMENPVEQSTNLIHH